MVDAAQAPGLSVLMVTRRFWPLTDDAAGRLAVLAEGLRRGGVRPTILAARYSAAWPHELEFREMGMVRPMAAPRGDWSTASYSRALVRWMRERAAEFDLLYGDNLREEGAAVVEAADRGGLPSVVRSGGTGENADAVWAATHRAARRTFAAAARGSAIIAPSATAARALVAAGVERPRVHRIDDGIPAMNRVDDSQRLAARVALASINSDLAVPRGGIVILFAGAFASTSGLSTVAHAVAPLCQENANLRFWLIGDGPMRESLHHYFRDSGIRERVAMPGCFGHVDELVQAANIVVVPSGNEGLEQRLPAAIGAGLPAVVCDAPEIRDFLGASASLAWTYRRDSSESLANILRAVLDDYPTAAARAADLKQALRRSTPRERSIAEHLRLFRAVAGQREVRGGNPTTDAGS